MSIRFKYFNFLDLILDDLPFEKIVEDGTQNRRKLFEDKQQKKTEYECSQEKIIIQETFSNNAIEGVQDQHLFDFSFLSQQEKINDNSKEKEEDQQQKTSFNNEQSEATKNADISQSLSQYMGISPINGQSHIKRNTLTPKRYTHRKITKKDITFINTIINKSQFNNNSNSNRIDGSKIKLQDIASYFQLEGDKNAEPSYYKLISFFYAYKFLKTLLTGYINQNFNFLSDLQMKIINDKSYVCQRNSYNNQQQQTVIKKQKFQNIFERLLNLRKSQNNLPINTSKDKSLLMRQFNLFVSLFTRYILKSFVIINPNNFFLRLWDLIYLMLFFAICLTYPFYFSFMNEEKNSLSKDVVFIIQSIQIMTSLIDILLTSQTGIYVLGEIVLKREQVYKQYISQLLLKDILSVLVQILGILTTYGFPNFLAALLRINSIKEKFSRMDWHRKLKQKLSSYYDLLQLISFLLIVIHLFGCGFYYVGHISVKLGLEETSWIIKNNLIHSNMFDQYIRSIYFITITMVTIGYGDITPINSIEIIYSIFISFITCGLFGYCINFIGSIFTDLSKKSKDFQKKLIVITKYLNSRNIDQSSQIRVLRYLEYLDESQEENILEGYNILNSCSKDIKEDIMKQFYGTVIKKSRLFNETFSKEFIESLSLKMQERCFAPGETIIERGQILENLYFITRGQTEYFFDKKDQKNSICMFENQVIDLRIFLVQQKSDISIRSKGITVVSYFDHQTFQNTIHQYQDDYEKYIQLRDQFLNDQRFQYPCRSCGQYKHNIFDCPQITVQVDKSSFLKKHTLDQEQERNQNYERKLKKFRSLTEINQVKKKLKLARYTVISNLIDGYDSLKNTSTFFENNDDKQFFMLLPKINCIKLIESYKKRDEKNFQLSKQKIQTDQFINIQNIKFADDILQYTDSMSSSCSSSSSDESSDDSSNNQSQDADQKFAQSQISRQSCGIQNDQNSNFQMNQQNDSFNNLEEDFKTIINNIPQEDDIQNQKTRFIQKERLNSFASQVSQELTKGNEILKNSILQNHTANKNQMSLFNEENSISEFTSMSYDQKPAKQRVAHKHNSLISNQHSLNQSRYRNTQFSTITNLVENEDARKNLDKQNTQKVPKQNKQMNFETSYNNNALNINQNASNSNHSNMSNSNGNGLNKNLLEQLKLVLGQLELAYKQKHKQEGRISKQQTINNKIEKRKSKIISFNLNSQMSFSNLKNQNTQKSTIFTIQKKDSTQSNKENIENQLFPDQYKHADYQQTNSFPYSNSDCLFGKCGFYFDAVKEYQHYYPKFNYNCVIKSYKKQKQFQIKQIKQVPQKHNDRYGLKQQNFSQIEHSQIKLFESFG